MSVSTGSLFKSCYGKYAVPAINIWCMEQVHALFSAARMTEAPFIVQMTPVAIRYANSQMLVAIINAAAAIYKCSQFSIHLDHGTREAALEAIASGAFSSVMIDASHEPYENNIKITREIVKKAHAAGMEVEAELGILSGVEDDTNVKAEDSKYTQPDQVEDFVYKTGCDSLAIAVGTSHGAYKFPGEQRLRFEILEEIQQRLTSYPLVLHGGSSINLSEVNRINAAGGYIGKGASGIHPDELRKAISYGVCKINIATDSRILWTRVHREFFKDNPGAFDPVVPGKIFMEELEKLFVEKFRMLQA